MSYSARRGFSNGSKRPTGAQRQAEMQQAMNETQAAVEAQEFSATVGGGVVTATVNGKKEVLSLSIKPEAVDPDDVVLGRREVSCC